MELQRGIPGINYDNIRKCNELSIKCNELTKKNNDKISINSVIRSQTTVRLEPPYNTPCSHINISNCQKSAAFKLNNNVYYCWYHMHCK